MSPTNLFPTNLPSFHSFHHSPSQFHSNIVLPCCWGSGGDRREFIVGHQELRTEYLGTDGIFELLWQADNLGLHLEGLLSRVVLLK